MVQTANLHLALPKGDNSSNNLAERKGFEMQTQRNNHLKGMNRRQQLWMPRLAAMLFLILVFSGSLAVATDNPNILFIMSDDHTTQAIGAYGSRLAKLNPTPNIDRLAHHGIRFDRVFCTNSICCPSRATILTGQYGHINRVRGIPGRLPSERQTLPILMRQAGYDTALIGKWHLSAEPNFDYYATLPGQGSYFNPIFRVKNGLKQPRRFAHMHDGPWDDCSTLRVASYDCIHSTDAITALTLNWLSQRSKHDRPFFLMLHFKAPHDNFENAERYDFLYDETDIPEPASLWERGGHGPIGREQYGTSIGKRRQSRNMGHHMFVDSDLPDEQYKRTAYQRYLKKYLRCVKGVDDAVGQVFDRLEKMGQLNKTLIVYTSDQGFMLGEHDYIDKRWVYEESMRMPFIVRYPKMVKPGSVNKDLIANTDFAPTLLALAGIEIPDDMQGRSFLPMLRGEPAPENWRTGVYYRYWLHMTSHANPAHYAIRTKRYKLIFFYGLPLDVPYAAKKPVEPYWELYDLQRDPRELNNVYGDPDYAQVRESLKQQLLDLKQRYKDTDEKYPELMAIREHDWDAK